MLIKNSIRKFSFDKDLLGAASADYIGIAFPDESVLGSNRNIKLRFDSQFMKMAEQGKL